MPDPSPSAPEEPTNPPSSSAEPDEATGSAEQEPTLDKSGPEAAS
jgi:hypothetical protein